MTVTIAVANNSTNANGMMITSGTAHTPLCLAAYVAGLWLLRLVRCSDIGLIKRRPR